MLVGDIFSIVTGALTLIRLIDETSGFYKECRDLRTRCYAVQKILGDNQSVLTDHDGLKDLIDVIDHAIKYLTNRRNKWFIRNPLSEKLFFLRIAKYESRIDSWIITVTLSLTVKPPSQL